mmetsp:Transcript_45759/g.74658  ORF Transcript_45759/g.74658 Transcript_45759/m.74658 type:complete len:86 (-) Transcript_45759:150-407(-)
MLGVVLRNVLQEIVGTFWVQVFEEERMRDMCRADKMISLTQSFTRAYKKERRPREHFIFLHALIWKAEKGREAKRDRTKRDSFSR